MGAAGPEPDLRWFLHRANADNRSAAGGSHTRSDTDTRSDAEHEIDAAGLGAATREEFRPIQYYGRAPEGDLFQFNEEALSFLTGIGSPAAVGPSLVEDALDAARAYAAVPEAQRELYRRTEESRVVDLYGPQMAREAYAMVAEMLKAGIADGSIPDRFAEWLVKSGAIVKAEVIHSLATIADFRNVRANVKAGGSLDGLAGYLQG